MNYSRRPAKGNLRRLLGQIAWATKGAAWAVAHRIAKAIWMVLHEKVEYQEKGRRRRMNEPWSGNSNAR